jgi:outer membrane protein TolC
LFLFVSVIVGCVNQQKEVSIYRKVVDEGVENHVAEAYQPGQPLTLRQALLLANQNNENIDLSGENYLQALIDKDRAVAGFLPTIDFVPTYLVRDKPKGSANTNSTGSRSTVLDVPVTGEINLFNGFRDVANLRRAAHTIEQRREQVWEMQQTILLDVAQTYYRVLSTERQVEVLTNSLRVQEERLRDIRGRQQAGLARQLDVAQIQAQASATHVALLQAQRDTQNGRVMLSFLIAVPVGDTPLVDEYPLDAQPAPIDELLDYAHQNRKDLRAAEEAVLAARQAVEIQVGRYYPSLSLNVAYFLSRQSTPTDVDWTALFQANLPIFSAGLIEADVRLAWSQFRQARLDESLTSRQIEQDVRTAAENMISSDQQLRELQTQLEAAQVALRQAEESYRVGLATNLERIVAQDQLLSAQLQLTQEQFNRKVLYLTLVRAIGKTFVQAEREYQQRIAATQPATAPTTAASTQPAPTSQP